MFSVIPGAANRPRLIPLASQLRPYSEANNPDWRPTHADQCEINAFIARMNRKEARVWAELSDRFGHPQSEEREAWVEEIFARAGGHDPEDDLEGPEHSAYLQWKYWGHWELFMAAEQWYLELVEKDRLMRQQMQAKEEEMDKFFRDDDRHPDPVDSGRKLPISDCDNVPDDVKDASKKSPKNNKVGRGLTRSTYGSPIMPCPSPTVQPTSSRALSSSPSGGIIDWNQPAIRALDNHYPFVEPSYADSPSNSWETSSDDDNDNIFSGVPYPNAERLPSQHYLDEMDAFEAARAEDQMANTVVPYQDFFRNRCFVDPATRRVYGIVQGEFPDDQRHDDEAYYGWDDGLNDHYDGPIYEERAIDDDSRFAGDNDENVPPTEPYSPPSPPEPTFSEEELADFRAMGLSERPHSFGGPQPHPGDPGAGQAGPRRRPGYGRHAVRRIRRPDTPFPGTSAVPGGILNSVAEEDDEDSPSPPSDEETWTRPI